jgi:hypothetical protein
VLVSLPNTGALIFMDHILSTKKTKK